MNKIVLLFLFTCICITLQSQVAKLSNGIVFSSINSEKMNFLNNKVKSYSLMLGLDYCNKRYYNLSSEIGFLSKGGREKDITGNFIYEKWNYIHINTTMRIKYPFNSLDIYCGFGPYMDFLVDTKSFRSITYDDYKMNKTVFGIKPEIGFNQTLSRLFSVGVNCSCLYNLTHSGESSYNNIKNNAFLLSLVLSYKL